MKNIAVQRDLTNISDYLSNQGYNVDEVEWSQINSKDFVDGFDAVVITGIEENIMGIEDTMVKSSIIDASGLTPRQVKDEIEKRIK